MAGILHKIEEKLGMGGGAAADHKKDDHNKVEVKHHSTYGDAHKANSGEHKEGMADKIKDKIKGGDQHSSGAGHDGVGEKIKKKKKEKKKHGDGHHDDSSSSDSD